MGLCLSGGGLSVSAAGFKYDGKNINSFKSGSSFTIDVNLSGKALNSMQKAYKKNSSVFEKVTKITFSDNVKEIPEDVFSYFPNVKNISIGKNVSSLPETEGFVMEDGSSLKKLQSFSVSSKNSNYKAKGGVLYNKKMTKLIKVPENYKKDTYKMPATVARLGGDNAITNCINITEVGISKAFEGSIRGLDTLGKLTRILVDPSNKDYVSADGVLYDYSKTKLICWPAKKSGTAVILPETLKTLNVDQLPDSVTSLTLPKDLNTLYSNDEETIYNGKEYPLNMLKNLTTVSVAEGNTAFTVEGGALYNAKKTVCYGIPRKTNETIITIPEGMESISVSLLYEHDSITKLVIPSTLKADSGISELFSGDATLSSMAEYEVSEKNEQLKSIDGVLYSKDGKNLYCYPAKKSGNSYTIPDEVENIFSDAFFEECTNLTSLTFGKSVTALGESGIRLPNLTEYQVSDENAVFTARDGVLYNKKMTVICGYPKKKADKTFTIEEGIVSIDYYTDFVNDYIKELTILGDISFPDNMGKNLPSLASISVGGQCRFKVENDVLFGKNKSVLLLYPPCKDNAEYTIPDKVINIYKDAFCYNKYLKKITLGKKTKVENGAGFGYGMTKLEAIEAGGKNKNYTSVKGVLYNKKKTALLIYPSGKKAKTYTLPKTVKNIFVGSEQFQYNKYLKKFKVEKGSKWYIASDSKTISSIKDADYYVTLIKSHE